MKNSKLRAKRFSLGITADNRREYNKKYKQLRASKGLCILCGEKQDNPNSTTCSKCQTDKKQSRNQWRQNHPVETKIRAKKAHDKLRQNALQVIARDNGIPLACPCGCADIKLLEINHLNHDGREDAINNQRFYRQIKYGLRSTKDLNILCKLCNFQYYLEHKFKVKWSKNAFKGKQKTEQLLILKVCGEEL